MKKVKFTLGLMLSMLFLGASVGYAADEVTVDVKGSPYFGAGKGSISYIAYAVKYAAKNDTLTSLISSVTVDPEETKQTSLSGGYTYETVVNRAKAGYTYYQEFTVKLPYDIGKEAIPFLQRKIQTKAGIVQDLLLAYEITDKTQFAEGSGIATYVFRSNLTPLIEKYNFTSIEYNIWIDAEISNNPGAANAYPTIPRAVTVYTEDGLSTLPAAGITRYVNAYDDYTFEVYGERGKKLSVTTNNPHYAIDKGIKVASKTDGVWAVKITGIYLALNITVSYEAETEGLIGSDDGSNGNLILTKDAVWAAGGQLYVKSATPAKLEVYSVTGQLQKVNVVSGSATLSGLPKGIYLVKLNGKTYKVIN